jgi:hypothetical protein
MNEILKDKTMKTRLFILFTACVLTVSCGGHGTRPGKDSYWPIGYFHWLFATPRDLEFGHYGYSDKLTGKTVIPFKYDYAGKFHDELARVKLDGKYGLIDRNGKEVIPPLKYDDVGVFSEGLVALQLDGKWGFADMTGKTVIPFKYDLVGTFSGRYAFVKLNGKSGYIDKTGKEITPLK